jgi:Zn ribbon nucleic-acid-binding protein
MKYVGLLIISVLVTIALVDYYFLKQNHDNTIPYEQNIAWEQLIEPGELSAAHEFLSDNCTACHTPITGIERTNCVACHANDAFLLQRQPTVFHADIANCSGCHVEHRGRDGDITNMDHQMLVKIGLSSLQLNNDPESEEYQTYELIKSLTKKQLSPSPLFVHQDVSAGEATLRCSTCHANDDRHFSLFGNDCVQCHRMDTWNLAEFRHPSTNSQDCVQCHQGPPSHYMMHFKMISAKVAGEPNAKVEACHVCHQTTSWNDIKRAGWYKHH